MKICGYQIREGIKRWLLLRDTVARQFDGTLFVFEDEGKETPEATMAAYTVADMNLARVEELQQRYNQLVTVQLNDQTVTLAFLVKLVGGAGRREKMWREAAVGKKDRYSYREDNVRERDTTKIYAKRAISVELCAERARSAAKFASDVRSLIARSNAIDVDCPRLGLSPEEHEKLFG